MKKLTEVFAIFFVAVVFTSNARAAEVSSTNLTLDPAYDVAGCALVSSNGYGGTDRQLFIPTVDAYYTIKGYSSNNTEALITVEAFDPNQRLLDQALAGNPTDAVGRPSHVYLTAGTRVLIWAVYTGGYGTITGCQGDGATETVTMRVVGEDSAPPSPPTALAATALSGGASIAFTPGAANGSAITNYQYGVFNGFQWTYTSLVPADTTSPIVVTGFTNGVPATLRLKAVNANGASTDSGPVTFTPIAGVSGTPAPVPVFPPYLLWLSVLSLALIGIQRSSS